MLAAGAALVLLVSACQPGGSDSPSPSTPSSGTPSTQAELPTVIIGSADFDESAVLAEIYAQALEAAGFTVERNLYTGTRETTLPALESGELNLMPEYIGSLLTGLGGEASGDSETTFADLQDALAEVDLVAFEFSEAADQDAFAVTSETAEANDLVSVSDAAPIAADLTWGLPPECETRQNCGIGLNDLYGIDMAAIPVETIDPCGPAMAEALNTGAIDVGRLCSTQPEIVTYNLVVLEDDQHLSPADNLAPVVTQDLADAGGDLLASTLNGISAALTTDELTDLYFAVAVDAQDIGEVAQAWLEDNGLL
jgi:osmoprotectant transport system substrate-binding protein